MGYNVAQTLEAIHSKIALQMALEKISHQAGKFLAVFMPSCATATTVSLNPAV
ncbi:hypothetical protein [Dyadobacter sp. CY351]|uniref:hypothetical protein n=1 Tax=Dyadobacter sp. CY351 TaxID=2909337 RepID=UPI001F2A7EA3|nr:hypothetical protein [Dyadobacter sp. CY351]MCF2518375.1 hypothetical protein [Dyadobacter sp. CY351]